MQGHYITTSKGGNQLNLYDRVKELADERKISICALEKQAGIGNGVIGKWRESVGNFETVRKVAAALEVPIDELVR